MADKNYKAQKEVFTVDANQLGTHPFDINLDKTYSRCTRVTLHNRGAHKDFSVGIRPQIGSEHVDIIPWEEYQLTETHRGLKTDFPVNNNTIIIDTEIDIPQNSEIKFALVFHLEK